MFEVCLQIAADGLKGRVFEVSLADLQQVLVESALCPEVSPVIHI